MHQWDHRRLLGAAAAACVLVMWQSSSGAAARKTVASVAPTQAPAAAPATAAPSTTAAPAAPPPAAAAPSAGPATVSAPAMTPPMTAAQVIEVLDQTVDWYRTLGIQQQAATEPSDLLILYDNRQTARKIMSLAFDIARADADMLGKMPAAAQDADADGAVSSQTLQQLKSKLDAQNASIQEELNTQRARLDAAAGKTRVEVQAKINELQEELDLVGTKRTILDTMAGFATSGDADGSSVGALKAQIDAMAVAIPSATGSAPAAAPSAATVPATGAAAAASPPTPLSITSAPAPVGSFGLWDLASNAFRLSEKSGTIRSVDQRTAALQATVAQIRTPLIDKIKALSARGDSLAAQADSADSTTLNDVRAQLATLADQFKQSSALIIPLSREGILLSQFRRNLGNWRDAVKVQFRNALKTLGVRVAILAVVLVLLFAGAELWRRGALRYVQDSRRRYQLLLLRRIALWSMIVVVIGVAFASELGSIVTFAGLITAGIAVAMQSVLVSIVGYFFLIGKYGIRVGDRVQIGEVAGEVIDLGLVRMYLMELGAKGALGPTGRVVAFANSVVFQVSSGLFKQIPGVNFTWREITLILPAGVDYAVLKEKLQAAMTAALEEYRPEFLRQTQEIQRTTSSSSSADAQPQVQLTFSGTSVEAHIRYPVHLQHAAEIDERVTQALAKVLGEAH